jgi:formiminoglutamase
MTAVGFRACTLMTTKEGLMVGHRIPYLRPPELVRRSPWQDGHETRVANWIQPWDGHERFDVGLLMVPIARGAIKHVAAHLGPNALRMVWPFFTTYSIDYDVELASLRVRDLGDVEIPLLDVAAAHRNIEAAVSGLLAMDRKFLPITIGGEHSLAHPLLRAFKHGRAYERIGLIQFDAHMDFQTGEHGPHNGTPIRAIIEDGIVAPTNLVQIGIAGFVQAAWHAQWGREQGVTIFTARDVAMRGIAPLLEAALAIAGRDTDAIYVTFDIDCFDQAFAPGTGASLPGGLTPWQAFESLFTLGRDARVQGFDLVEIDPSRDVFDITARLATKLVLTFLAGYQTRPRQ